MQNTATMTQKSPPPLRYGFRVSKWDALILLLSVGLTSWLRAQNFLLWWIVPVVVGHFFLFCNVFRVWWRLELSWAVCFVMMTGVHLAAGYTGWLSPLIMQTPATLFVAWLQMRSPWYHGILARRVNPRLNEFLNGTL